MRTGELRCWDGDAPTGGPGTPEAEERPRGERARDGGESRTADESPVEAIPLPPSLPLVG